MLIKFLEVLKMINGSAILIFGAAFIVYLFLWIRKEWIRLSGLTEEED